MCSAREHASGRANGPVTTIVINFLVSTPNAAVLEAGILLLHFLCCELLLIVEGNCLIPTVLCAFSRFIAPFDFVFN